MLNALAGEFFAALPGAGPVGAARALLPGQQAAGGVPVPSNPLPAGFAPGPLANGPALPGTLAPGANVAPTSPQGAANQVASIPSLVPHAAAPNGLPDSVATAAPAFEPRLGGHALGVPEGYAAALPDAGAGAGAGGRPAPSPPTSPYYFLGEARAFQPQAATPELQVPGDDRVTAQSFGLPGADTLRSLLAEPGRTTPAPASAPGAAAPGYYFVEAGPAPFSARHAGDPQAVPQAGASARPAFDVQAIRRDFPILQERVNGRPLVWFDNAATTQKPQSVIDRVSHFYAHENSNIHRAAHELAARATDAYEKARETVRRFIGAGSVDEVIFVRGATEAINLVAKTWGVQNIQEGDEIIVSNLEHHANIVPWQQLAAQKGAKIRVIPVDDTGQVLLDEYQRLLNPRTRLVAVTQVSNALGTVVPVAEIVAMAHRAGARTLVDGAQSVSHMKVDVRALDTDFFVFSGHKIFGPTGIGVVYGKKALLEEMPPWQGGGNMIADVTFERTVFQPPPNKFEAGTGNIADAVGLGAALDYVERIGIERIARYEHDLLEYATHGLIRIPGLRLIGTARDKASVASFVLAGHSTEEVGKALNQEGIAVRSGHHCAQPILRRFGVEATVRPSLAFYNTCEEVDLLVRVVDRLARARR
ncbi:cysteine desulfurase /L-selenocysteine selenide-lyase (L-alanine-forming) [Sphaerotilus hippei]|uniref:Cysteine desulfurase n=2 Tax=Sphaerotilus hippei TaxID=744406 RepID=A0A318GXY1_9BURK|nr:cysteine desulfurase /L-selenocysteine selenide-lyase (L-alanine-forming) [Sphaerotilus hippei]